MDPDEQTSLLDVALNVRKEHEEQLKNKAEAEAANAETESEAIEEVSIS